MEVDSLGLKSLTLKTLSDSFQVSDTNPLVGLEGRWNLLKRLGSVMETQMYFQKDGLYRPGFLLDYLLAHESTLKNSDNSTLNNTYIVQMDTLWDLIMKGFSGVWPASRTILNGKSLGTPNFI